MREVNHMRAVKINEVQTETRAGGIFTGTVEWKALVGKSIGALDLAVDIVSFPPGVRNKPHSHSTDQVLYILSGKGFVANDKEEVHAEPGMLFFIPRLERHWHGAANDSSFSHISILGPGKTDY